MERPRRLTAGFVKAIETPGRYGDGRGGFGLSLLVKTSSAGVAKSWSQRLRIDGEVFNVGLGPYPVVTLSRARDKALANLRTVEEGGDPRKKGPTMPTFRDCLELTIETNRPNWKSPRTEKYMREVMRNHVLPYIGRRPVNRIGATDILDFLRPLALVKPQVARRAKIGLSMTFKWAIAQGLRTGNPADQNISSALPKLSPKNHHGALPFSEVAGAISSVRQTGAGAATKLAFEFLVLTAARSCEIREATWGEIDREAATWSIPAARMKSSRDHRVPLSAPALAVLDAARALSDGNGLVFPSPRGKPLTDATLSKLLRENEIGAVPHGFRSSFRDWCAHANIDRQVAEASLAHSVGNATETAYLRSDMFELRRAAMVAWGEFLSK